MPTTTRKTGGARRQTRQRKRSGRRAPIRKEAQRVPDQPYPYVVENGEPAYVLVPTEEYERMVKAEMARDAEKILEDPNVEWVDADEFALQLAADRIARARKAKNLTQKQLAQRLKVPQSQISRIERNPDRTTVRTLKRIARALGVDVSALI